MLTGGQTYHWALKVKWKDEAPAVPGAQGNNEEQIEIKQFDTKLPAEESDKPEDQRKRFSSVTVLTAGMQPPPENGIVDFPEKTVDAMAAQLEDAGAVVMRYRPQSQNWSSVTFNDRYSWWDASNKEPEKGKPLVLVADWKTGLTPESFQNAGVAEAAADNLFASIAKLDLDYGGKVGEENSLYDDNGNLIRKQGAVFNAPLHFIGFGQGAVVNTEIIQRLGTYFPEAGGFKGEERDLHMTTVDPFEYNPETVPQFRNTLARMLDPEIVVWDNVTYADNYYQVQGSQQDNKVLIGKALEKIPDRPDAPGKPDRADINYELKDWAGFDRAKEQDNAHRAAVAWYGGTADVNESQIPAGQQKVFRRLGDLLTEELNDPNKSWFVPGHTKSSFTHAQEDAPWEGIGTGWFYSVNGGGDKFRPYFVEGESKPKGKDELGDFEEYLKENRTPVTYDNTYTDEDIGTRMRGDYATTTVFNGNFDVVAPKNNPRDSLPDIPIAGWSDNNEVSQEGDEASTTNSPSMSSLIDWKEINSLDKPYTSPDGRKVPGTSFLDRMGINSAPNYRPNYALKLEEGESITHNPFIVPDWGILRFNLHIPSELAGKSGKLNVTLKSLDSEDKITETILLNPAKFPRSEGDSFYNKDINRDANRKLGYGTRGFETFHVFDTFYSGSTDPQKELEKFRGKRAIVKFELEKTNENIEVYLDDVFFKSANLKFGQPIPKNGSSLAKYSGAAFADNPFKDRLLLEKPQYTLSYNGQNNIPNWASFQINNSWIALQEEKKFGNRTYINDKSLPSKFYQVTNNDYRSRAPYTRGHLTPISSRSLSLKDNKAVNMMSNFVPQHKKNNLPIWEEIENYAQDFVRAGREVYVITGIHQIKQKDGKDEVLPPKSPSSQPIKVPQNLWKAMLVLDRPHATVPDATDNIYAVGFYVENKLPTDKEHNWRENWNQPNKGDRIVWSIKELEDRLQYNLFPNLPSNIKKTIEKNKYIYPSGPIPNGDD
ncbi:MAG: DNA/RNA non-specific endonuclease, partial [Cyanobacteriota bacterium]|nr:DNA/RNA non-specific endonuclease [Cyanobacteriota bacterium]